MPGIEMEEGGQEFLAHEIAGATEDDEKMRCYLFGTHKARFLFFGISQGQGMKIGKGLAVMGHSR